MAKMQTKENIGHIRSEPTTSTKVTWVIRNYFSLPQEPDWTFLSPLFTFLDEKWRLAITPNGTALNSVDIWFTLARPISGSPIHRVSFKVSIKKNNGQVYVSHSSIENFKEENIHTFAFLRRSRLLRDKDEIMLKGNLTIHCLLKAEDGTIELSGEEDNRGITTAEVEKDSKTELGNKKETLSNPAGTIKLSQDFKELLLNGSHFDTTIKIGDREFRAHRAILSCRSPVFGSMFRHDTTERNTGTVEIKDCDPDVFQEFLAFAYTGMVEKLSSENVFDLYTVADKYDVRELKTQCVAFMKNNLSVANFCDVITVALRYKESQLLETAKEFFVQNASEIAVTVKWLSFHKEYPVESNELYIKLLDHRHRR